MCGCTNAKVNNISIDLKVGYSGGELESGKIKFYSGDMDVLDVKEFFNQFTKDQLIDILCQFIENGDESC